MQKYVNAFYLKYIRPADPGFFLAKYAGKAAFSCLVSFFTAVVIGLEGKILFWWMAGAVCTVLFRTGSTLKRRKIYALVLLTAVAVTVPVAAVLGQHIFLSLGFIFLLAFVCFFIAALGVSASTVGTGCLIITLISIFSPAPIDHGVLRSVSLVFGGLISFFINFYLWPFDPEKVLFSSVKLAIEDMAFFLEGVCIRVKNPNMTDNELSLLSREAIGSVRRYRTFLESFNIDPLKGSGASGGPGLFYFALVRMFESIVGLLNHIHFSDNHSEFSTLRENFYNTAVKISHEFDRFSKLEKKSHGRPGTDFDEISHEINNLRRSLLTMGGYKKGDEIQEKFQVAWAAVYALKTVMTEFQGMRHLAEEKFRLRRPS